MPIYLSDGAKSGMNSRFPALFNGGKINVYTGPQPESASHAPTGTLLAEVTAPNGLRFIHVAPYASKDPLQEWTLLGLAQGIAGWFRLIADPLDPGFVGDSFVRLDGLCWTLSDPRTGLILPSLEIDSTTNRPIIGFNFSV